MAKGWTWCTKHQSEENPLNKSVCLWATEHALFYDCVWDAEPPPGNWLWEEEEGFQTFDEEGFQTFDDASRIEDDEEDPR